MSPEEFVNALRKYAGESAVRSEKETLIDGPTGRRPPRTLLQDSHWFRNLAPVDRSRVLNVARRVMDTTLFGVFCILDGVRQVEDVESRGEFNLKYVRGNEEIDLRPEHLLLHELYRERFPFR